MWTAALISALLQPEIPQQMVFTIPAHLEQEFNQAMKEYMEATGFTYPDPQKAEFKALTRESKQGMRIKAEKPFRNYPQGHNSWPICLHRFDQR